VYSALLAVIVQLRGVLDELAVVAFVHEAVVVVVVVARVALAVAVGVHLLAVRVIRTIVNVVLEKEKIKGFGPEGFRKKEGFPVERGHFFCHSFSEIKRLMRAHWQVSKHDEIIEHKTNQWLSPICVNGK
jgi:hypothetical protein